jgi:hypothetical protein
MRRLLLLLPAGLLLFAGNPKPADLPLIDRLNEHIQLRFQNPLPDTLGMSRVAVPRSMGTHFRPKLSSPTDFVPENAAERQTVAKLEANRVQLGLYVFGADILKAPAELRSFRALKGPAAITAGTPRPAWYPGTAKVPAFPDPLPDWNQIYPVARRAMAAFHDGSAGFETTFGNWDIAARPVAAEKRCAVCHGAEPHLGGVLYAFRRPKS